MRKSALAVALVALAGCQTIADPAETAKVREAVLTFVPGITTRSNAIQVLGKSSNFAFRATTEPERLSFDISGVRLRLVFTNEVLRDFIGFSFGTSFNREDAERRAIPGIAPGVTHKADVVAVFGKPERWSLEVENRHGRYASETFEYGGKTFRFTNAILEAWSGR
jgi:hypothetical protein